MERTRMLTLSSAFFLKSLAPLGGSRCIRAQSSIQHQDSSRLHSSVPSPPAGSIKLDLLDKHAAGEYRALLARNPPWRQIIADLAVRYCPWPRGPLSVCLLPEHPLVIITINLLRAGLNIRAVTLLDRMAQGSTSLSKPLGPLYLSPQALEMLVDASLERKYQNILPALTRELARTQSTRSLTRLHFPTSEVTAASEPLALRLSEVYAKLMDAHFQMDNHGSVLELYSAATRALVPCSPIIYKRAIQSLFKRFIPSPESGLRRASRPNSTHDIEANVNLPEGHTSPPPVDLILEQLRLILNKMVANNMIPSSRLLADVFRGLGSILKLETYGVESGDAGTSRNSSHPIPESDLLSPSTKNIPPRFRLDRLILDEETWSFVGKMVNNILAQTTNQPNFQHPGNEGRALLQMAWADVMLSLREDVADATTNHGTTKEHSIDSQIHLPFVRTMLTPMAKLVPKPILL
ncbi:hypothetical protein BDV93DRAFT_124483 [Ceratobasidium sp. AG-I]|nr:hypothetical protein BDV93DRAFT_124483 [Ceratobasidium sp. AG-I]